MSRAREAVVERGEERLRERMIQVSESISSDALPIAPPSPAPAALLLFLRQLANEDRNENDVVDSEHDFKEGESEEGDRAVGREKGIHAPNVIKILSRSPDHAHRARFADGVVTRHERQPPGLRRGDDERVERSGEASSSAKTPAPWRSSGWYADC